MGLIATDWHAPPAIIAPAQLEQVKRKRGRDRRPSIATALVIGAIILGDDGTPCRVVAIQGPQIYCVPLDR